MPRAFSELEKTEIRESMKKITRQLIATIGFRKLSIDLIVERTNIAKGSFYAFFKTKEDLVMEILDDIENAEQGRLIGAIETATNLADFLDTLLGDMETVLARYPELRVLSQENEISRLMLSLDEAARARFMQKDLRFAQSCIDLARKKGFNPRFNELDLVLIGRSFFTLALDHENPIDLEGYEKTEIERSQDFVRTAIRRGIIKELLGGDHR